MKIERSKSKSGLFLIELIIAIVFFAVASAVCIQLFVQAYLISDRSSDLSAALILAQNYAEEYKAQPFSEKEEVRQQNERERILRYYGYNEQGDLVEMEPGTDGPRYVLSASFDDEFAPVLSARILVHRWKADAPTETPLCALDVKSYEPANAI